MQQWFEHMVTQSPDFLMLLDKEFNVLYLNKAVNGIDPADVVGYYLPTFAGPKMEEAEQKLQAALDTGVEQHYDTHFDDPYEKRHYFVNKVIPLSKPIDNAVLYIVSKEVPSL